MQGIGSIMSRSLSFQITSQTAMSPSSNNTAKKAKSKKKLNGNAVLSDHVTRSMIKYFKALNGTPPSDVYRMVLEQVEAPLLKSVLEYSEGNQSQAAEVLGLNRGTLRKKLKQYGIEA